MPVQVLNQLDEFSSGGFILLTFDEEGNPRLQCRFDSSAHSLGAQKYLSQWLETVDDCQKEMIYNTIMGGDEDDE